MFVSLQVPAGAEASHELAKVKEELKDRKELTRELVADIERKDEEIKMQVCSIVARA